LPIVALVLAVVLAIAVIIHTGGDSDKLTELDLAGVAWSVGLAVYGAQGLISVMLEGHELRPGRVVPHLTGPLTTGIGLLSLALFGIAILLAIGLTSDWDVDVIGLLAGAGCIVLASLLVCYKEAYVGDEATLDNRDDGIPW
jgi:hypothetical protein